MPTKKLKDFLDRAGVEYVSIPHLQTFTAPKTAHSTHISGKKIAKTVMIWVDGEMAMAVLPSNEHIDLALLEKLTGAETVMLATEREFKERFPGCEVGAMPPFGNLYGMDTFVSPDLQDHEEIAFNAGSHTELVQLAYEDFERLAQPRILDFAD